MAPEGGREEKGGGEGSGAGGGGEEIGKSFFRGAVARNALTDVHTHTRGCARVGVYLYICHDLNRDNPPGFIPKSIIRITL